MWDFIILRTCVRFGRDVYTLHPNVTSHLGKPGFKLMSHNYQENSLSLKVSNCVSFPLGYSWLLRVRQRTNCSNPRTVPNGDWMPMNSDPRPGKRVPQCQRWLCWRIKAGECYELVGRMKKGTVISKREFSLGKSRKIFIELSHLKTISLLSLGKNTSFWKTHIYLKLCITFYYS